MSASFDQLRTFVSGLQYDGWEPETKELVCHEVFGVPELRGFERRRVSGGQSLRFLQECDDVWIMLTLGSLGDAVVQIYLDKEGTAVASLVAESVMRGNYGIRKRWFGADFLAFDSRALRGVRLEVTRDTV